MENRADLHIHSIYSDGLQTPEEIFQKAVKVGINGISLTDHDSVEGCIIALDLADKYPVEFLTGIEFSCHAEDKEYHILGYNIDVTNDVLHKHLAEFKKSRHKRALTIIQKLEKQNVRITIDDILAQAGAAPISRPHIAAVIQSKGYVRTSKEAFTKYIGDNCSCYVPKTHFPIDVAIKLINHCGGVAVLGHPAKSVEQKVLFDMIEAGLDGIEVVHPLHNYDLQNYYHNIAIQYWLLETGGSDFHGSRDYDEPNFGKFTVPYSIIESIRSRARR